MRITVRDQGTQFVDGYVFANWNGFTDKAILLVDNEILPFSRRKIKELAKRYFHEVLNGSRLLTTAEILEYFEDKYLQESPNGPPPTKKEATKNHVDPKHYGDWTPDGGQWLEHYAGRAYIGAVNVALTLGDKYIDRAGLKDPLEQDLLKALWYYRWAHKYELLGGTRDGSEVIDWKGAETIHNNLVTMLEQKPFQGHEMAILHWTLQLERMEEGKGQPLAVCVIAALMLNGGKRIKDLVKALERRK